MTQNAKLDISKYHRSNNHRRRICKLSIVRSRLAPLLRFFKRHMRWSAMVCDASRSSESQENDPFHPSVWQGLISGALECFIAGVKHRSMWLGL